MENIDIFKHVRLDELARLANAFSKEEKSSSACSMVIQEINRRLRSTPIVRIKK